MSFKAPCNLLVDPVFTARSIARCSSFWGAAKLAHDFCAIHPETRVSCLVPNQETIFTVDHASMHATLPSMRDWSYIPYFCGWDRYQNMYYPSEEHRRIQGEFGGSHGDWDVLVTNRNSGQYFRHTSWPGRIKKFLCLYDTFPIFPFKATQYVTSAHCWNGQFITLTSLASYCAFDLVFVEAPFEKREIMAAARQFLAPARVKELDRIVVAAYQSSPLSAEYVCTDEARENFCTGTRYNIIYAQKIQESQRRFSDVFRQLQLVHAKLSAGDLDIALHICTQSAGALPQEAQKDSRFLIFEKPPREEFWKKLKTTHVQISFSLEEDMPKGLLEGVLLGVIPVVSRRPWSEDMFGRDYPFFARNEEEAYAVIAWIGRNRTAAWERFVAWYTSYFVPQVLPRGNASEIFRQRVERFVEDMLRIAREKNNRMAADLLARAKPGDVIDLLKLPSWSRNAADVRKMRVEDIPYSRIPRRWQGSFILRHMCGWQPTEVPWQLVAQ